MSIAIVTCLWGRHGISGPALKYNRVSAPNDAACIAVGSEGEVSRKLAEDTGWSYYERQNHFVSKWNYAGKMARQHNPEWVCWVGSSTVISSEYFKNKKYEGDALSGLRDMWCYDIQSGKMGYYKGKDDTPWPGRMVHRSAMEKVDWEIWPKGDNYLDQISRKTFSFLRAAGEDMEDLGCICVNIKSGDSMTPFTTISYEHTLEPQDALKELEKHGLGWIETLRAAARSS